MESVFQVLIKKFVFHVFGFQENDFNKFVVIHSGCSPKDNVLCVLYRVVCADFPDGTNKIAYTA